jgi:hypothetical protein
MTGDSTDKRPPGERPRRGARREPALLDLKADSVETAAAAEMSPVETPAGEAPAVEVPTHIAPEAAPETVPAAADSELEARPADVASEEAAAEEAANREASPADEAAPATPESGASSQVQAESTEAPAPGIGVDDRPEPLSSPVPPVGPTMRPQRTGLIGPALAGLAAGFIGAGLLTIGFLLFGPAGDIGDRLAGLESAVGERASRRTVETLEKRVSALDSAAGTLRGDLDALGRKVQEIPASDLANLFGRVDRVERNLADLAAQPAPASGQPASAAPAPQAPPLVAARESAVLAIALLMRDALDRGTAFQRELNALQSAGVSTDATDALRPFAAAGAPGAAALAREFAGIAERIANPPPPPAHGLADKVTATFSGLFRIRPVGEAEGDSPAALAARAEALLQRGALKDAASTIDRIPPADAAPARDFQARLKARIAASDAASTILSKAVDELLAAARLQGATR